MEYEEGHRLERTGVFFGFLFSYAVFTTILYYVLHFLDRLPFSWTWMHVALITLIIVLIGMLLEWWL